MLVYTWMYLFIHTIIYVLKFFLKHSKYYFNVEFDLLLVIMTGLMIMRFMWQNKRMPIGSNIAR